MIYLLYTIHVLVCLFLILVVLLQQGKGADLSVFGGGATQAAFGSRGAVSLLHKLTVWSFVAFIFTTVAISFATSSAGRSSVMSNVPEQTTPVEATESEAAPPQPAEAAPSGTEAAATEGEAPSPDAGAAAADEAAQPGDGGDGATSAGSDG